MDYIIGGKKYKTIKSVPSSGLAAFTEGRVASEAALNIINVFSKIIT